MRNLKVTENNLSTTNNFDDFFNKVNETFKRDVETVINKIYSDLLEYTCENCFQKMFFTIYVYNKGCKIGKSRLLKNKNKNYCKKVIKKAIDSVEILSKNTTYHKDSCSINLYNLVFPQEAKNQIKEHFLQLLLNSKVDAFANSVNVYINFDSPITFSLLGKSVSLHLRYQPISSRFQKKLLEESLCEFLNKPEVQLQQSPLEDVWVIHIDPII